MIFQVVVFLNSEHNFVPELVCGGMYFSVKIKFVRCGETGSARC